MSDKQQKLKICFIGWVSSAHTARWVKWFADNGHDVHFITNEGSLEGVNTYVIPESFGEDNRSRWQRYRELCFNSYNFRRFKRRRWLKNLLKEIDPDILHSHALWSPGNLGVFQKSKNFVVTVMNGDVMYHHGKDATLSHDLMVRYAMRKAKLITGVSQTLIDAAMRHGAKKDKTCVVRRGVDSNVFNSNADKNEVRKQLGFTIKYVVLSPRYLAPVGNVETLIRSIPLIVKTIQDIQFVFIFPNECQLEFLKNLAKELNIEKYLNFVGSVPHEQVARYHQAADIMVSIPLADSGPIALQEAMACGDVPVMSDLPCVREWIEPDVNGVLIEAQDKEALAKNIVELLLDEGKRQKFSDINRKLIEERGNTNKIMEQVEQLYYKLIKNKGKY